MEGHSSYDTVRREHESNFILALLSLRSVCAYFLIQLWSLEKRVEVLAPIGQYLSSRIALQEWKLLCKWHDSKGSPN